MAFTPAHAAAAVPLHRLLGSRAVLSALVIGSMTPDFAYFLPLGVRRAQSHSLVGRHPNLPVPGASHLLWGTIIGGFQGLSVALIGLGLAWRLGGARATLGERPT